MSTPHICSHGFTSAKGCRFGCTEFACVPWTPSCRFPNLDRGAETGDSLARVLLDSADHDQTAEEAEWELRSDGIDVDAFIASIHAAIREVSP